MNRTRLLNQAMIVTLAALGLFSLYLAVNRIIQVDEAQNVYMARIVGAGLTSRFYSNASLILLGPLSWIARAGASSEAIFTAARILAWAVYWLNAGLVAWLCAGARPGRRLLIALLAAASLAPMLDYGFEVRHDNLMLTLLLLAWVVLRTPVARDWVAFGLLGILSGLLQMVAFKGFLYWGPLGMAALAFPPPGLGGRPVRRVSGFLAGLLLALGGVLLLHRWAGTLGAVQAGLSAALGATANPGRFPPWTSLARLLDQVPLLLALVLAAAGTLSLAIREGGWRIRAGWDSALPEALLALLALAAFLVNPNPYPYNLVNLVPFLLLFVFRSLPADPDLPLPAGWTTPAWALGLSLVLVGHAIPFLRHGSRHLGWRNDRQLLLMGTAEALTDPGKDRVFDAAGLVPTRASIGYQWFLHSLVMEKIRDGRLPAVRDLLSRNPPAVVLLNYRTDWMDPEDHAYLKRHYLALSDDALVLGGRLGPGAGAFVCLHPGRYKVGVPGKPGMPVWVGARKLDSESVIDLAPGTHPMRAQEPEAIQVAWVGPHLGDIPRLPPGDHRLVFVNWY